MCALGAAVVIAVMGRDIVRYLRRPCGQAHNGNAKMTEPGIRFGSRTRGQWQQALCVGFFTVIFAPACSSSTAMATPIHDWSPPNLIAFLTRLTAVDATVGGETCLLTALGRDAILKQFDHHYSHEASNAPDLPSFVKNYDQAQHSHVSGLASDANGGGRGCDDAAGELAGCARAGRAAE